MRIKRHQYYAQWLTVISGIVTFALGCAALLGYQLTHAPVVQIEPTRVFMTNDAALGFCFAGMGLIFAGIQQWRIFTGLAGVLLVLLGSISILQYFVVTGTNAPQSISAYFHLTRYNDGAMKSITALFFVIIGLSFFSIGKSGLASKNTILIIATVGVLLFCLEVLHLFGYFILPDIFIVNTLHLFDPISTNTALGFIGVSIGIISYTVGAAEKAKYDFNRAAALLISVVMGAVSLMFWRGMLTEYELRYLPIRQVAVIITKELVLGFILGLAVYVIQRNIWIAGNYRRSYALAKATLESAAEGIQVIDNAGKIVASNQKLLTMWRVPPQLAKEHDSNIIMEFAISQIKNKDEMSQILNRLKKNRTETVVIEMQLKDGRVFELHSMPQQINKKVIGRILSFHDISYLKAAEKKLLYHATHDLLTGLANRFVLLKKIKYATVQAKKHNTSLALLFFDLDRFKLINDSLGHAIGDVLLKAVARRLRARTRQEDTLARLGGDEFVVLVNLVKHEASLSKLAEKYLQIFSQPFHISSHELFLNCTIGISLNSQVGESAETLLENADLAMYKAKSENKRYQFYNTEMHNQIIAQLSMEKELQHALLKNQLLLYYQPIINMQEKKICSVEALLRWKHPEAGFISPEKFIPVAEKIGLISAIGDWVLKTACQQFKLWQKNGITAGDRINVNVSERQLKQPGFYGKTCQILADLEFDPLCLEFELSENMFVGSSTEIVDSIAKFKKIGVQIAIDDFGIGHSSLTLIKHLPIDKLKVDKSYIEDLPENNSARAIVDAIILIGKELKLSVLAEGVETEKQLQFLMANHCDEIQGFYFSPALSASEYEQTIEQIKSKISAL